MVVARKYIVKKHFDGAPKRSDFELVQETLPALKDGEILVKAEWISVDPYQRAYTPGTTLPYDQFGFQVGLVQESKDPKHPVGSRVVTHKGWCDYSIIDMNASVSSRIEINYALPDLQGLSPSLGVGAIGMPGATAYLSFLHVGKPKPGETVAISGAAGAVGSLVGQIAKIMGCKVIGFAGSDKKCRLLEKELGFDKAYNYKTADITKALQESAPNGVDIYYDNVGGEISSKIMYQMNFKGRVIVVGSISSYNSKESELPKVTLLQPTILSKTLRVEGFVIGDDDWKTRWNEAFVPLIKWIKSGQIKAKEHIVEGFENLFEAFSGMLVGENFGKAVVKV